MSFRLHQLNGSRYAKSYYGTLMRIRGRPFIILSRIFAGAKPSGGNQFSPISIKQCGTRYKLPWNLIGNRGRSFRIFSHIVDDVTSSKGNDLSLISLARCYDLN